MSLNGGNVGFSLSYMMVVSASLVYATISYDYFEKGMSFLFTLPVSKKSYVLEKYLLTVLVELCVAAFVVLIEVGNILLGNPADWMTPEKLEEIFADVAYGLAPSRHNLIEKDGKAARPKFHIYFEIEEVRDAGKYAALKRVIHREYPFFDGNALDAGRFCLLKYSVT